MLTALIVICAAMEEITAPEIYAGGPQLQEYLLEAAENRPELHAMYETWQAALMRHPQVTSLEDPMFSYGQFLQSEMNRFRVMIAQRFPWFGTLRARGDKALAEADVVLAEFYAARNQVFFEVKQAYFDYAYLHDQIEVLQTQLELYAFVEETVRNQFALGVAREDEVRDAQIRYAEQENRLAEIEDLRPALSARLAAAIGRQTGELLPWPEPTAPPVEPPPAPIVVARMRVENPLLEVYDQRVRVNQAQAEIVRKEGYPNFTLALEYMSVSKPRQMRPDRPPADALMTAYNRLSTLGMGPEGDVVERAINAYMVMAADEPMEYSDGGEDEIILSLEMNLPIYRKKIRAGIAEAKHMEQAEAFRKEQAAQTIEADVRMAIFEYKDAARRKKLYAETLVPQAGFVYESLQSSYAAGLLNAVTDVLDAIDDQLAFALEQERAERDLRTAAAKIEYLMGQPWAEPGETEAPAEAEQMEPEEVEAGEAPAEAEEVQPEEVEAGEAQEPQEKKTPEQGAPENPTTITEQEAENTEPNNAQPN